MAPSDALPVGAARTVSEMQPVLVNAGLPGCKLLDSVIALLSPQTPDEHEHYDEEILDLTIVGFLVMWGTSFDTFFSPEHFSAQTSILPRKSSQSWHLTGEVSLDGWQLLVRLSFESCDSEGYSVLTVLGTLMVLGTNSFFSHNFHRIYIIFGRHLAALILHIVSNFWTNWSIE